MNTVKTLISLISDGGAFTLMVLLLILSNGHYDKKSTEGRFFLAFVIMGMSMACSGILGTVLPVDKQTDMVFALVNVFISAGFLCLWLAFLDWHFFQSRFYMKRRFWFVVWPILASGLILMLSVVVITLTDAEDIIYSIAFAVFACVWVFYFLASLRTLFIYKSQNGYLKFFDAWSFLVPTFVFWVLQVATGISLFAMGAAIGVLLLDRSVYARLLYLDRETGFYNKQYISYLGKLASEGKYAPKSAILFNLTDSGKMDTFRDELMKQLPLGCEPLRISDCGFMVLTEVSNRAPLSMVIADMKAVVDVDAKCVLKKKDETCVAFLERIG